MGTPFSPILMLRKGAFSRYGVIENWFAMTGYSEAPFLSSRNPLHFIQKREDDPYEQ